MELQQIAEQFLSSTTLNFSGIDNGLINTTVLVNDGEKKYILQKINTSIFQFPDNIAENHLLINSLLEKSDYSKKTVAIIPAKDGKLGYITPEGDYWRMTEFVDNSVTHLKVPNPETALKAAECFSEFYSVLNNAETVKLKDTLPGFINFKKRVDDYKIALDNASEERVAAAKEVVDFVNDNISLPEKMIQLQVSQELPERVIHADPKISNILFTKEGEALAVIDLDTLMNSTILYDFGDMMRSYCNLTDEDDASLVENFSPEIYAAVKAGFLTHLSSKLTPVEIENLDYAAQVVIYIQAVRFLTDYLNNDVYYSTKYPEHNLDRTKNQVNLVKNVMAHQGA